MVKSAKRAEGHAVTASASRRFKLSQHGSTVGHKRKTHTTAERFANCAIGFECEKRAMAFTSIAMLKELGMCWMSKSGEQLFSAASAGYFLDAAAGVLLAVLLVVVRVAGRRRRLWTEGRANGEATEVCGEWWS